MSRSSDSGLRTVTVYLHLATGSCFLAGGQQASGPPAPPPLSLCLTSVLVTSWQPRWKPLFGGGDPARQESPLETQNPHHPCSWTPATHTPRGRLCGTQTRGERSSCSGTPTLRGQTGEDLLQGIASLRRERGHWKP